MNLRYYQRDGVAATYDYFREGGGNPCIVLPTGSGKTPVLSTICRDAIGWGWRVCVVAHVKELLEQGARHLCALLPEDKVGIYSAGMNRRDTTQPIIVAGIQSIYQRARELGPFNLIIVDEAHLIPQNEQSMYQQFLADTKVMQPKRRVIGLTATPFRLGSGPLCGPDEILNKIVYEASVKDLIAQGYLCPISTKRGISQADMSAVHIRMGEYKADEMAEAFEAILSEAVSELVELTADRKSILVFAANREHAAEVVKMLEEKTGERVGYLDGKTGDEDRDEVIKEFKARGVRYLVNINVLTTGFDATGIDAIGVLRATMSPVLWCQMVGRGLRIDPRKKDCLVLDFGGNAVRLGPIDKIKMKEKGASNGDGEAPAKDCPQCREVIAAGFSVCPACGFIFPVDAATHEARAGTADIISGEEVDSVRDVDETFFYVHTKRDADEDAPKTMRVEYCCGLNMPDVFKEWVCIEHEGYAGEKARAFWAEISAAPFPKTAADAVRIANAGGVAKARKVVTREGGGKRFAEIIGREFEEIPDWQSEPDSSFFGAEAFGTVDDDFDNIPF